MSRLDFVYRSELPHRARTVYIYLADRANKDGECWARYPHHCQRAAAFTDHSAPRFERSKESRLASNGAEIQKERRKEQFALYAEEKLKPQAYSITVLPPRGNYAQQVEGGTRHSGRRR